MRQNLIYLYTFFFSFHGLHVTLLDCRSRQFPLHLCKPNLKSFDWRVWWKSLRLLCIYFKGGKIQHVLTSFLTILWGFGNIGEKIVLASFSLMPIKDHDAFPKNLAELSSNVWRQRCYSRRYFKTVTVMYEL